MKDRISLQISETTENWEEVKDYLKTETEIAKHIKPLEKSERAIAMINLLRAIAKENFHKGKAVRIEIEYRSVESDVEIKIHILGKLSETERLIFRYKCEIDIQDVDITKILKKKPKRKCYRCAGTMMYLGFDELFDIYHCPRCGLVNYQRRKDEV